MGIAAKIGLWPHACGDKHPLELAVTRDDGNVDWAVIDSANWVDPDLNFECSVFIKVFSMRFEFWTSIRMV